MKSLLDFEHLVPNKTDDPRVWDWTAAFNALMADKEVSVVIPPGTYYVRYPAKIVNPKGITAIGASFLILGILKVSTNYFRLTGLSFSGNILGEYTNTEHNIILENASNVTIEHCSFSSVRKTAIQFSNNGRCSDVKIQSCHFCNIGGPQCNAALEGMCVYIQQAQRVKVTDCYMSHIYGQSAIFACRSSDIKIMDSQIEYTVFRGIQTFSAANTTDVTDIVERMVIDNVTIRYVGHLNNNPMSEAMNGIFIRNNRGKAWDVKIISCTIEYCGENCLEGTFEAYKNTLRYSGYYDKFTYTTAKNAVFLHSNSNFVNNTIEHAKKEGVKVFWSRENILIQGNSFNNCGMSAIAVQADGADTVIEGVQVLDNSVQHAETNASPWIQIIQTNGGTLSNITEDRNKLIPIGGTA